MSRKNRRKRRAKESSYFSENFGIKALSGKSEEAYIIESISPTIINSMMVMKEEKAVFYEVEYKDRNRRIYEEFPPSALCLPYSLKHKEEEVRREMSEIEGLLSKLNL